MDSMENWLGFSLSHQENTSIIPTAAATGGYNKSEIHQLSGNHQEQECFHLITSSDSSNLPPPFGINLQSFNSSHPSQDWNYMSSIGRMGEASNSCNIGNHHQVKLENFLGGNSFTTTDQQYSSHVVRGCYNNIYGGSGGDVVGVVDNNNNNNNNTTIGLSMINNWLKTKTTSSVSAQLEEEENNDVNVNVNVVGANNGNTQSLSLSMSTGGGSTTAVAVALPLMTASSEGGGESSTTESNGGMMRVDTQSGVIEAPPTKSVQTFGQRTSIYRGVTRHRWTGRYEAHLWDNSCRREGQTRKGRQVYLGGYDKEEKAARSYDLAALKYWGTATTTNFPFSDYEKELEVMKNMTRQEYVASLRRKSSGFSRGASIYRGVTRHHQHGRWQARIGRVAGNKDLYLGTFSTQEEAAEAYDIAAIKFRGLNAVTNFEINRYDVNSILESSTLPIGGAAKRLKEADMVALQVNRAMDETECLNNRVAAASHVWPTIAFPQEAQPVMSMYPYNQQKQLWCKQEYDSDHLHYGNAYNFFQPSHVLHNLMSLDSSSFEHTAANAAAASYQSVGYGISNGYVLPIGEESVQNQHQVTGFGVGENEVRQIGYENNVFGSSDPYQTRNLYYHSQNSSNEMIPKGSLYDQGSSCDNWMTNTVPTAECHEDSTFTVWNDA